MPFTKDDYVLCLDARTQDASKGRFKDETPYGTPNQDRNENANIFLIAKMDENENLVFISGIDNSDPLNSLSWLFNTTANAGGTIKVGAYRTFLEIFPLWVNSVNYQIQVLDSEDNITQYPSLVYHTTSERFFKAIQVSGPATTFYEPTVTSGWEAYWEEITDFTALLLNDQIIVHIHDDIVTFDYEDCLKSQLSEVADDILCGVCDKWEEILRPVKMTLLLDEANSQNWQDKQTRAETILLEASKKFCC